MKIVFFLFSLKREKKIKKASWIWEVLGRYKQENQEFSFGYGVWGYCLKKQIKFAILWQIHLK